MSAGVAEPRTQRPDARAPHRAMPRTPRVLQVVLSLTPGGTEHLVVEICRRLAPEFGVAVCCLDDEGEWAVDLQARGIEVKALHRRPGFRPQVGRAIAQFAGERQIDVLHCHQYSPFVYGRIATMLEPAAEDGLHRARPPVGRAAVVETAAGQPVALALRRHRSSAVSHELRDYMIEARFPPGACAAWCTTASSPADVPSARGSPARAAAAAARRSGIRRRDGGAARSGQGPDDAASRRSRRCAGACRPRSCWSSATAPNAIA